MRAIAEVHAGRFRLALLGGLLLLCLAAHLTADLAWLYQHRADLALPVQSGHLRHTELPPADPHGEALAPQSVVPAILMTLALLIITGPVLLSAAPRPSLFHPPALHLP